MTETINIIFEDDAVMVIDKPAGLPVMKKNGGTHESVEDLLSGGHLLSPKLQDHLTEIPSPHGGGLGRGGVGAYHPAHRLDNDTSGCLVCAKTPAALESLRTQFTGNKVFKQYTALVLGEAPPEGKVETPIIHDPKSRKKMKTAGAGPKGTKAQAAHTEFKTVKKFLGGRYSLLTVVIKTGVRHQIRVHLASIGHPIAGDRLYQNTRQRRFDETGIQRQFLHASRIGFIHPLSGKYVEFSSRLAPELENVLTKLTL